MTGFDEGPEDFRAKSAFEYRMERDRAKAKANGNGGASLVFSLASFASMPVPSRVFIDSAELLPAKNVVLLGGDGGTGKSLLALQLALAITTGSQWVGFDVQPGGVLYVSAEDDRDEVHIRAAAICASEGIDLAMAQNLMLMPMAGEDAVLAVDNGKGVLQPTALYQRIDNDLGYFSPLLLILDNLADVYAGNENNRPMVKQFIGLLRRLAIKHDCTIMLLGHPSLSGLSSGSGSSGSTAWSNSVRCRMYLHKPNGADADDDPDQRILEIKKANYTKAGARYELAWKAGRFVREQPKSAFDRITVRDLERVRVAIGKGRYRHNEQSADWAGYVVAEVVEFDVGQGIPLKHRTAEQNRNLDDIRQYLAAWVRSKQLFIIKGLGPDRKPTRYYSTYPEEKHP